MSDELTWHMFELASGKHRLIIMDGDDIVHWSDAIHETWDHLFLQVVKARAKTNPKTSPRQRMIDCLTEDPLQLIKENHES